VSKRLCTLVIGLALVAAACGADATPTVETGADTIPPTEQATTSIEGGDPVETTLPSRPGDDYGFDPGPGAGDDSDDATPPDGPIDVGGGKVIEPVPVEDVSIPVVGEAPGSLMDAIMADLAGYTGTSASVATVVRSESVVWSDGSLGCPEPGVVYTQATVNGYWVVIDYAGQEYDYRANDKGYFVRCAAGLGQPPGGNPSR
jgi:hypothetical protein